MNGLLTDDDGDLLIRNRSLVIGDCRQDLVERIISVRRGELKEHPLLGGGVQDMVKGRPDPFWAGDVRAQLKACGVEVKRLEVNGEEIEVELKVKSYEKD
jgi:hypothetical protein